MSPVSKGWVTVFGQVCGYVINAVDQLSLAIPPWVGAVSTVDGYSHHREESGEFCILVGPATRTVGRLVRFVEYVLAAELSWPSG